MTSRVKPNFGLLFSIATGLSLSLSGIAAAQGQATATGRAAAPMVLGPTDFLNAALYVVGSVDRYEMADIWEKSSPIMKASIARDRFVANTAQNRAILGAVSGREWGAIMRVLIVDTKGPLPPGRYMSIRFNTAGQNGTMMEEVVSFHLDKDGQWKLAGYTIGTSK